MILITIILIVNFGLISWLLNRIIDRLDNVLDELKKRK